MQLWNFKTKAIIFKRKGLYMNYKPFLVISTKGNLISNRFLLTVEMTCATLYFSTILL